VKEEQEVIAEQEDALAFLKSVYQNEKVPLPVRMRAAQIAIEYERPRLAMTAQITGQDVATLLEQRIERAKRLPMNGMKLID
jgi:hypothetical protein